ncbi:MAG TPA: GNAT family N-acetyltransferase [Terrimesophilobacter sp.]|nr:GNAT family N-acetyltransferase [Terrimesophilobacter sp.]
MTTFTPPRALQRGDPVGAFDCGVPSLNNWFRTLALTNQISGGSRTFITSSEDRAIAGFYCLSSYSLARKLTGDLGVHLPDPVPAILIGRLAVDLRFRGQGLGASLLQDAFVRAVQVSHQIGSAAIAVHAGDETVVPFYARFGFTQLPGDRRTLLIAMADAVAVIERLHGER